MHIVGLDKPGSRFLLQGNEAVARGALEGGVQVATGYPGTPSSEVIETLAEIAKDYGIYVEWSINEKVAFDVAVGAASVGARAIVTAKNAGVNWYMDMFATVVYGGLPGGLVVYAADDPGAFYSSTEQDTRPLAKNVGVLILEPADQGESKEMVKLGFDYSEKFELPVFVRSVTRISHSSGDVLYGEIRKEKNKVFFNRHYRLPFRYNVYGPYKYKGETGPSAKHAWQLERLDEIREFVEEVPFNQVEEGNSDIGIIASGIGYSYVKDALARLDSSVNPWVFKIGTPYPLPAKKLSEFLRGLKKVLVVEEGDPLVEDQIKALSKDCCPAIKVLGRGSGTIRSFGELGLAQVLKAVSDLVDTKSYEIDSERRNIKAEIKKILAPRSSMMCAGCPHLGTYWVLRFALHKILSKYRDRFKGAWIVNGDIGCYEMGGYGLFAKEIEPQKEKITRRINIDNPYEILDTNYIMGGGIGIAQGQYHAGYRDGPIVAVAGDSTFFHACMPALLNATYNKAAITFLVLDNSWTAMTGHQPAPTTGITATGSPSNIYRIEEAAKALGVDDVWVVDPYNLKNAEEALLEAIDKTVNENKTTLVIFRRECALQVVRRLTREGKMITSYFVDTAKCVGCRLCVQLGCPAIGWDKNSRKAFIDPTLCVSCSLCAQVCPVKAIKPSTEEVVSVKEV
ncbi:MAG: thiamine pyrophosphate-dependent enzyme [Desulfurococcaceae archaeon TW002]